MKEQLQEVLNDYAEDIERYKHEIDKLRSRIEFCSTHNFSEEERITRVKYDTVDMIVYRWDKMHKEIQKVLNK